MTGNASMMVAGGITPIQPRRGPEGAALTPMTAQKPTMQQRSFYGRFILWMYKCVQLYH